MKKYIKIFAAAAIACSGTMAFTGCSEEKVYEVDFNGIPMAADYTDNVTVTVDQATNYATFSFSAPGVYPVWILDGKSYSSNPTFTKYYRKAGDYQVEVKIGNANGISDGTIVKTFHVDNTMMTGFGGFVYENEHNLWLSADKHINSFYYAPGWAQLPDPSYTFDGETFSITLPSATFERWQCQAHLGTDICLNEGESYDGSFIFTSTQDISDVVLKIHPDGDDDDNHSFFCNQKINLTAGEPVTFWFSDLTAVVPMNNLVWTFDFGGNPDNINITVENFVLKSHAYDDGTELPEVQTIPEPTWVGVDSSDNLWAGCTYTMEYYYATGDSWTQLPDPVCTFDGKNFTIELPTKSTAQWQAQQKFHTDLSYDGVTAYDFKIVFESNTDLPGVTVKLTQDGDDNNFFFAEQIAVPAETPTTYWCSGVTAGAMDNMMLVLDYGGNPDGTTVKVSNIILQVHHD